MRPETRQRKKRAAGPDRKDRRGRPAPPPAVGARELSPTLRRGLAAAALLLVTVVAYLPALGAGFIWDDDRYVTHNPTLGTWSGLAEIWRSPAALLQYYPLTHTTFWVQHRLWGVQPAGYHLVNVVLHGANAIVLWLVLRRLAVPAAWLVAAVFALHPVHVESVAWVSELKNVQSGLFYLLAALALVVAAGGSRRAYAATLVAFLAAMLSKTVACTLPVALLPVLWWKRGRLSGPDLWRLGALVLLGVAVGLPTVWMERRLVGAEGAEWAMSFVERCLVAGRALWFYAGKLVWPVDLAFVYPRWHIDAHAWVQYLWPLGAIGVLVAFWVARGRLGLAPLAGVLFFGVTLAPALGFFNLFPMRYSFVADHFQYLASIGPIALLVGGAAAASARWRARPGPAVAAGIAAGVLLVVLGATTWRQTAIYRTPETLWRDTLAKNPEAWMAHLNLGRLLLETGRPEEAEKHFERALAIRPRFWEALYNMGNLAAARGRLDDAAAYFERALEIEPRFAPSHNNLANVYAYQGRRAEAIAHYERALELMPNYAEARSNLSAVRAQAAGVPSPTP